MTMGMRWNKRVALCVVVLIAAVAFGSHAVAQVNQAGELQVGPLGFDLSTLQRMGPGGDLAGGFQATAQGAGGGSGSCPQETCYECLYVDTYNPNDTYSPSVPGSNFINVAQSANALTLGQPYVITIVGTVSYWSAAYYTAPIGTPGTHPMFPSPAVASALQGDVASDWEYLYAYPNDDLGNIFVSGAIHIVEAGISVDNGATFNDLVPLGGQFYSTAHSYSYLVQGQGLQAQFRVSDSGPHSDNYGRFHICIYRLAPVTSCGTRN